VRSPGRHLVDAKDWEDETFLPLRRTEGVVDTPRRTHALGPKALTKNQRRRRGRQKEREAALSPPKPLRTKSRRTTKSSTPNKEKAE
jgi:hypothetical protein